ncbi:MAG: hypothetical protein AAGL24_16090 [Pseudomonadota bacterium]
MIRFPIAGSCLVLALAALPTLAKAEANTCVASAPNGSTLAVHDQPDTGSAVLGGIGVGQCGLRVTNQCSDTWCVVVFQSLNGWVQMRHVSGSPVTPPGLAGAGSRDNVPRQTPLGTFEYTVIGGTGSVTMAGRTQPTPVDPGSEIRIRMLSGDRAEARLPREVTVEPVGLRKQGGNVWSGRLSSWGGIPLPVDVLLEDPGADRAVLRLTTSNAMVTMRLRIDLALQAAAGASQVPTPPRNPADRACQQLAEAERMINARASTEAIQELRGLYTIAGLAFRSAPPEPAQCRQALDLIGQSPTLQVLLDPPSGGGTAGVPGRGSACVRVRAIAEAMERVRDPRVLEVFNTSVDAAGIMDLFAANEPQCARLLVLLEREGLGDPASVANSTGGPSTSGGTPAACALLSDRIRPILRGGPGPGRSGLMSVLARNGIANVSRANEAQCVVLVRELVAAGVLVDDGILARVQVSPTVRPGNAVAVGTFIAPDPADFIPENAGTVGVGNGSPCLTLADGLVTVLQSDSARALNRMSAILRETGIRSITGETATACMSALSAARQQGIVP